MRSYRRLYVLLIALALAVPLLLHPRAQPATAAPPAQAPAVDARIEIVWPHDGQGNPAPVDEARFVNVEVYLFERGTLNPVSCSFSNEVMLRWGSNDATRAGVVLVPAHGEWGVRGERVMRVIDGKSLPVWVFNDVPVTSSKTYFFVAVTGADVRTNIWAHSADSRTILAYQIFPMGSQSQIPPAIDSLIQIVWPHDAQGHPQPVSQATLVNVGVDLAQHPVDPLSFAWTSVGFDFHQPVQLYQALNNGFLEMVRADADLITTMTEGSRSWPRWEYNDVDVTAARDPANKYYFAVQVDGVETHPTIWTHGADPRTYFPQRDVPARSCSN